MRDFRLGIFKQLKAVSGEQGGECLFGCHIFPADRNIRDSHFAVGAGGAEGYSGVQDVIQAGLARQIFDGVR